MDEEKLRGIVLEAVAAGFAALEKQREERWEDMAIDIEDLARRFDLLDVAIREDMKEIRLHLAALSREGIRDRRKFDRLKERLDVLEQRKG